ncbi:hypothetical protein B0J14DRAFT_557463 [Halenospora varia]|nr:hypothetical protein B0J14DRAFT_557463 [Halenospora varia]
MHFSWVITAATTILFTSVFAIPITPTVLGHRPQPTSTNPNGEFRIEATVKFPHKHSSSGSPQNLNLQLEVYDGRIGEPNVCSGKADVSSKVFPAVGEVPCYEGYSLKFKIMEYGGEVIAIYKSANPVFGEYPWAIPGEGCTGYGKQTEDPLVCNYKYEQIFYAKDFQAAR